VIYASFLGVREKLLPFPEPDRFVKFWRIGEKSVNDSIPLDLFAEYSASLTSLEAIGGLNSSEPRTLTGVGEAVTYGVYNVSVNLLKLAGIPPLKGRLFDEADLEAESDHPIIISEQMWREKLGANENIIGHRLRLNDELHLVVGVMPAAMRTTRLAWDADIWVPHRFQPYKRSECLLFGRLKPGVSLKQAQAEARAVATALEQTRPGDNAEVSLLHGRYRSSMLAPIGKNLRESSERMAAEILLAILFGTVIVSCVVGISCFNVANLLLARLTARSRELAVRLAMGAERLRIVRLLLMESVLLGILGGLAGLVLSAWLIYVMRSRGLTVRFDPQLFLLAAGGSLLLGVLVGLVPAVRSARTNLTDVLKDGGQSTSGRKRHRLRNFLVSSEIAMTLVLCVAAGLTTRAYLRLQARDLGFDPDKTLAIRVNFRSDLYPDPNARKLYMERARQALEETPGISSVAIATSWSMMVSRNVDELRIAATGETPAIETKTGVEYCSRELPALYGMDLLLGRLPFPETASAGNEAVVNESFVRKHLSARDPIGLPFRIGRDSPDRDRDPKWRTIVGVVRDRPPLAKNAQVQPKVFLDYRENPRSVDVLYARTTTSAKAMSSPLRNAVQRLDALQPVEQPLVMADFLEEHASFQRITMILLGALGGGGLFMALLGVYGVVAFSVQERTREVGIRMAVGASRWDIHRLMLWQGARLIVLGGLPGLLLGTSASVGLQGMLGDGSSAFDPVTCLAAIVIVAAGGFLASFLPARKAAQLNPMTALHYE
jgi:putative ABC transport system permease protein